MLRCNSISSLMYSSLLRPFVGMLVKSLNSLFLTSPTIISLILTGYGTWTKSCYVLPFAIAHLPSTMYSGIIMLTEPLVTSTKKYSSSSAEPLLRRQSPSFHLLLLYVRKQLSFVHAWEANQPTWLCMASPFSCCSHLHTAWTSARLSFFSAHCYRVMWDCDTDDGECCWW